MGFSKNIKSKFLSLESLRGKYNNSMPNNIVSYVDFCLFISKIDCCRKKKY